MQQHLPSHMLETPTKERPLGVWPFVFSPLTLADPTRACDHLWKGLKGVQCISICGKETTAQQSVSKLAKENLYLQFVGDLRGSGWVNTFSCLVCAICSAPGESCATSAQKRPTCNRPQNCNMQFQNKHLKIDEALWDPLRKYSPCQGWPKGFQGWSSAQGQQETERGLQSQKMTMPWQHIAIANFINQWPNMIQKLMQISCINQGRDYTPCQSCLIPSDSVLTSPSAREAKHSRREPEAQTIYVTNSVIACLAWFFPFSSSSRQSAPASWTAAAGRNKKKRKTNTTVEIWHLIKTFDVLMNICCEREHRFCPYTVALTLRDVLESLFRTHPE